MKFILIVLLSVMVIGCSRKTNEVSDHFILPKELKRCSIHRLDNGGFKVLYVVHCPNATTTTTHSCGKNCTVSNTLIDEGDIL